MTTYVGQEAILKVGGTPVVIGGILSWDLEESVETMIDDTGLNDAWRTVLNGAKLRQMWSGSIRYKYDWADAPQITLTNTTLIAAIFFPSGATSTHLQAAGSFVISSRRIAAQEDNGVMIHEINFDGTGALTWSTVA